jgi:hypothetical protein
MSTSDRFVKLREAHLADGHGSRNTHHRGGDEILSRNTKTDVGTQHGSSDGRESRGHGKMDLGLGHHYAIQLDLVRNEEGLFSDAQST